MFVLRTCGQFLQAPFTFYLTVSWCTLWHCRLHRTDRCGCHLTVQVYHAHDDVNAVMELNGHQCKYSASKFPSNCL